MNVTLEFGGGAELLFNKVRRPHTTYDISRGYSRSTFSLQQKQHKVTLPDKPPTGDVWRIQELLYWVRGLISLRYSCSDHDLTIFSIRQPPAGEAGVVSEGGHCTARHPGPCQ